MGLWVSRLLSVFGEKEARILVLGLDNAGKTTILCADPWLITMVLFPALCILITLLPLEFLPIIA